MRIFVHQISSGRFLTAEGTWTQSQSQAKPFDHFLEALVFARDSVDEAVGAYCVFDDTSLNFSIYLGDATAAGEWEEKVKGFRKWFDLAERRTLR